MRRSFCDEEVSYTLVVLAMFVGIGALTSTNLVDANSWRKVEKWFKSDYNIYTKQSNSFDFKYKTIPASAYYLNTSWYKIGSGWNYIRYQNTRHYHGGH
ncbi:hypothetical protein AUQ39_10590 [Lacticaseibacillus casei]|nr:hypothetical protein AAW28_13490 [Lacticaseibacillus casei]OLS06307.1 hypothetical protein AUQ39_10590 [Lacticaseibacillus casei]